MSGIYGLDDFHYLAVAEKNPKLHSSAIWEFCLPTGFPSKVRTDAITGLVDISGAVRSRIATVTIAKAE